MSPYKPSPVLLRVVTFAVPSIGSASCLGPLPPENPRTQLEQPAEVVPIEVVATADGELAAVSGPEQSNVAEPRVLYRDVGLRAPDSVLHDRELDLYLVANSPSARPGPSSKTGDGSGFISRLSPDGSVERLKFIDGSGGVELNAPRGLWIAGDSLYVADVDHVRSFDAHSGAPRSSWKVPGAISLHKVTTDATGNIYVSDSGGRAEANPAPSADAAGLYRIAASGSVSVIAKGASLSEPSGIAFDDQGLLVVSLGGSSLTRYDIAGKSLATTPLPSSGSSGLVAIGDGQWLISSQQASAIYRGDLTHGFEPVVSGVAAPGDIGFDAKRQRVLIPLSHVDEVWAAPLPAANPEGATVRASR